MALQRSPLKLLKTSVVKLEIEMNESLGCSAKRPYYWKALKRS